ncbi:hypothetical protein PS2_015380 [Malus domestica]
MSTCFPPRLLLCSSTMAVKKASNLLCSFFIFPATPCKSSHSREGMKSPMLNTPANTIISTTMDLNSSAFGSSPPMPLPKSLRPTITRPRAFTVHTFSSCAKFTGFDPALANPCASTPTSSYNIKTITNCN